MKRTALSAPGLGYAFAPDDSGPKGVRGLGHGATPRALRHTWHLRGFFRLFAVFHDQGQGGREADFESAVYAQLARPLPATSWHHQINPAKEVALFHHPLRAQSTLR